VELKIKQFCNAAHSFFIFNSLKSIETLGLKTKLISFASASQCDQLLRIPQVRKEARVSGCSGAILGLPFFMPIG